MKLAEFNVRTKILLAILGGMVAFWLVATVQNRTLEGSLQVLAEAKTRFLDTDLNKEPQGKYDIDLVPRVTVAREYLVFGAVHGKVHIYLRSTTTEGRVQFGAYDFFYDHDGSNWTEMESGFCSDAKIQSEANALFASMESR